MSVFNAKFKFNPPKQVTLNKDEQDGFGISIRGSAPTIICKTSSRREVNFWIINITEKGVDKHIYARFSLN